MLLRNTLTTLAVALLLSLVLPACQTLREVAALRLVRFEIDDVRNARLAGIDLARVRSYEDLSAADVLRLSAALATRQLPFEFVLHLEATNPADNQVQARLVQLDWTLLLENRETVAGTFERTILLPPGQPTDVPINIRLDLLDFFERNARDLVELALAVSGQNGAPKQVSLQATPVIDTPVGPLRYPQPITIVSRDVGS
jgi:hypothetical protein